ASGATYPYSLKRAEMVELNRLGDVLNRMISDQVTAAKQTGIDIAPVDPNIASGVVPGFSGHALCDSQAPWINGVVFDGAFPTSISPFSFHPNALGQEEFGAVMQLGL